MERENMEEKEEKSKGNFWLTVAGFIVSKRKAIEILFFIAIVYSILSIGKTQVNQDITKYLPADSETRIGLSTMEKEFVTYGSAKVMVSNITYEDAEALVEELEAVKGIKEVSFDQTRDHYRGSDALFDLTATGGDEDAKSIAAMNEVKELLSDYDVYVDTSIGAEEESSESLSADMNLILVLAILIIIAVLLVSTKSFCEIPVLLITFGVAAILNMGTNYLLGEISSVTNSIAVVLQLALAIDYAIILCDRYMEEHETKEPVEAITVALSKAIPEISSSSLTTVSGMAAMMFMQFRLGYDMGIVLIKAILLSLISVFFLMPGLILIFAKGIDKTRHRSYVPKIGFVGKFASLTKYIIPPVFLVVIILSFIGSSQCQYLYDVDSVESAKKTEARIATEKITDTFGSTNQLVVMVPAGNYEKEATVLDRLSKLDYVTSVLGLANQSVNDDYVITDKLNPRQFSELTNLDIEVVRVLYSAYAYGEEQYGPVITGVDDYEVPIIDMFLFLYDQYQEGYVTLSADLDEQLTSLYDILHDAKLQLQGENYSRFVLNIDKPSEGEETYEAMEEIRSIAEKTYGSGKVILVGDSTSCKDLEASFATDNIIISVLTALFVLVILFFTFQSAGLPVLLVLTIQGSIWINFTVPALQNQGIYFIAYLIVSAIQMGATIDYAIVISSRYMELKYQMPLKEAISETLNQAFPTIFTSGTILTCAGFLIGQICSEPTIAAIGTALGRGTLISIILVLFVLPQILLLGDYIIEKTALAINLNREQKNINGRVYVSGHIRGYVEGVIDADIKGNFQGKMQVSVDTLLPGRQGEITEDSSAGEKRLEMKDEDVIDAENADEKRNGGDAPGTNHAEDEKGGEQHE
jgi:predicted RND superfamily exporter protein